MAAQEHTPSVKRPILRSGWLPICFLLALLQIKWAGHELGVGNQSIQIPFLLHLHDAHLFARDLMVTQTIGQYPSLFFRALAYFLNFLPLPTLYFALHVATATALFLAVIALCSAMFNDRWTGLIACGLLIAGHHQALAEQTLYSTGFTHTWAVFPMVIAALALFYANRPVAAFALAGFIFNIHALDAAQLGAAMGFWAIASIHRLGGIKFTRLFVVFALFASPTLFFLLFHHQHVDELWFQLMHVRSAHHSFPFSWWSPGQPDIPQFLIILALAALALSQLKSAPHLRTTLLLTTGVFLLILIGVLFTEVWPQAVVIRAQLLRSSRFLMIIALACIAAGCREAWKYRHGLGEFITALLVFACLAVPPWLILLPWLLVFVILMALFNRRLLWPQALFAGATLLVCLAAWRSINFVVPGLSPGFSWKALATWPQPTTGNDPAWIDVQIWARNHTPANTLFLTPAQASGFRVHSERSVVGEWRDGTQLFFSGAFTQPWWDCMVALQPGMRLAPDGHHLLVQGRSISQLKDEQVISLADRFQADYIILSSDTPRTLTRVYHNDKWSVYRPTYAPVAPIESNALAEQQHFVQSIVLPNIEKFRQSNARLRIIDATGRPLYDAHYRIQQTDSLFLFGSPVTNNLFHYTVATEPARWMNLEPQDHLEKFEDLDRFFAPHIAHNDRIEFSSLAGFPPSWLKARSENEQNQRLLQHAVELVTCYADKIDYWQITDQDFFAGQTSNLVARLHASFPQLKFGISLAPRLFAPRPADRQRGLPDVRQLKADGVPLDFISIQGHQPWGVWAEPKTLYEIFDAFAQEGLRIHITAFAAPSEGWIEGNVRHGQWTPDLQAEYCRLFYSVCFSHPAVDAVNYLDPGPITRVPGIGLININGVAKPAWHALEDLITHQWRTATNGTLALDGSLAFRGFQGQYTLEVSPLHGNPVTTAFTLGAGTNTDFRFQINAAGALVPVR